MPFSFKMMLSGILGLLYITCFCLGNHYVRETLFSIDILLGISLLVYYLSIFHKHLNLKEYFWTNLSNIEKEVMNYPFHRDYHSREATAFHPFARFGRKYTLNT